MIVIRCPFNCGVEAKAVIPPLALAAIAIHLAEQVSDTLVHNWTTINQVNMVIETGHIPDETDRGIVFSSGIHD